MSVLKAGKNTTVLAGASQYYYCSAPNRRHRLAVDDALLHVRSHYQGQIFNGCKSFIAIGYLILTVGLTIIPLSDTVAGFAMVAMPYLGYCMLRNWLP